MKNRKKQILFVTNSSIGDAVLTTGILNELLQRAPDSEVTVCASPLSLPLFKDLPALKAGIPLQKRPLIGRRFSLHFLNLWRKTAFKRWDVAVDFRNSPLLYILPVCKKRLIAKTSKKNPEAIVVQNSKILGKGQAPLSPVLWVSAETEARAMEKVGKGKYIVAAPTANNPMKTWPEEKYIELLKLLTAENGLFKGYKIILLGGKNEAQRVQKIIAAFPKTELLSLVGETDLLETYAIIRNAALFVGNDSGLSHIASATETPGFSLFGPTNAEHYGPCGKCSHIVKTKTSYQDLMANKYTEHPMETLDAKDVLSAITAAFKPASK